MLPIYSIDLPKDFLNGQERCGHFVSSKMKKIWAVEIDLMVKLLQVCKKHGIHIFVSGGTLLGAARHQGMIPWDDDIDIWMPRPDYERLLKEYDHPYYKVLSAATDKNYPLDFPKVHDIRTMVVEDGGDGNWGVFIDIFILDGIHSPDEGVKMMNKVAKYRAVVSNQRFTRKFKLTRSMGAKKFVMAILGKIAHTFISLNKVLLKEDAYISGNDYEECDYASSLVDYKYQVFVPKKALEPFVLMPFEDRMFRCPADSHVSLVETFGPNYMTPPPPEKRYSVHSSKAFWK